MAKTSQSRSGGAAREIKRLRDEIATLKQRQRDFDSQSQEWSWEMGADLRFSYFSGNFELVTGVSPSEMLGKTREEMAGGTRGSVDFEMHLAWIQQHKPFRDFRYRRIAPDGREMLFEISGIPVVDEDGTFLGYRGIGRDLTELSSARAQLAEAKREMLLVKKAKSDALAGLKEANALLQDQNAEMQRVQQEIEHTALHDPLTGVGNRRFLDTRLLESSTRCRIENSWLGVLHIDLDRFKQINDTMGHAAGDAVLSHVADVLKSHVRDSDYVARVGGDEFVVVSTRVPDRQHLAELAQRLIETLSEPILFEGRECWFGASIGIAAMRGDEIVSEELLTNADIALYRAKDRGRGCYQFFSSDVQRELIENKQIADGIRRGLERDEFVPWYQPQVCARTWRITGVEALARWERPGEGVLTPDRFLGVAADLNAVPVIDRTILERALEDLRCWDEAGVEVPRLSVNVSARRLLDQKLVEGLNAMQLPRERVSFELLESVFLDDADHMIAWNIDLLREMGLQIELDDFGSGHASIISLVKLKPDTIKIDRQLVYSIATDPVRANLVAGIVAIAKSLDVAVVAEGVETAEQADLLREMEADRLQGYFVAKPMPAEAVPQFVADWTARTQQDAAPLSRRVG
jgi:diguanylate cyclase (GGDEF)-like protein/PAS domain S-box-containing protein